MTIIVLVIIKIADEVFLADIRIIYVLHTV